MQQNSETQTNDQTAAELERYRTFERNLAGLLAANPEMLEFLDDWSVSGNPAASIVKRFGDKIKEFIDSPDGAELLQSLAREKEKQEQEYDANLKASLEALKEFREENRLDEEDAEKWLPVLISLIQAGIDGNISKETMAIVRNGINYAEHIRQAEERGELKGRNTKIEALYASRTPDTLPNLSHSGPAAQKPVSNSIFSLAAKAR